MQTQSTDASLAPHPTYAEAFAVWLRIGLLSFGGPTGQIALMHRMLVDERKWIDDARFLNALNFCMLLPGPEAMQLATYIGWRLHGIRGGLTAGLLFVIPGALVILALSLIYALFGQVPVLAAIFLGIKAAVLIVVVEALLRISKRALKGPVYWLLAALSFIAIFFFRAPYPLIVFAAALIGYLLAVQKGEQSITKMTSTANVPFSSVARTAALWLTIWIAPLLGIAAIFGRDHVLTQIGYFFSKLAIVTFGGAYAVLAYMGQDVASHYGWITAGEMLDGLGLAETTPGPLILVTEFVGTIAAYRHGGAGPSIPMALLGALITLWATFAPCFLWVFTGAPYVEWLNSQPRLKAALAGVTAAVVGVILNLTVWFALHVAFGKVGLTELGPLKLYVPDVATLDPKIVILAAISAFLLLWRHWNVIAVLAVAAAGGWLLVNAGW
jgi:chromate transporter